MPTVEQKYKATFDAQGAHAYSGALGSIGQAASSLGGTLQNVLGSLNPMNLAMKALGAGAALYGVAQIGSSFENMQISMAQTLRMMGEGGDTWEQGMVNAEAAIAQVNAAAAALPGEAEDYASAMALAGASVQRATGDYQLTFDLIKQTTAVGISMGASAEQSATFLNRMLNSQRGMLDMSSDFGVKLLDSMKQMPGQANLTTQAFNAMDLAERTELVTASMGQFQDMVEASSNTWDAVVGATATTFKTITRMASAGLFTSMTTQLGRVNDLFMDADGNLTAFAQKAIDLGNTLGNAFGDAINTVVDGFVVLANNIDSWMATPGMQALIGIGDDISAAASSLGSGIADSITGSEETGRGMSATLMDLGESVIGIFSNLTSILEPVVNIFLSLWDMLTGLISAVLPPMFSAFETLSSVLGPLFTALFEIGAVIMNVLSPIVAATSALFGAMWRVVESLIDYALRPMALGLLEVALFLSEWLLPPFRLLGDAIGWVIDKLTDLVNWISDTVSDAAEEELVAHRAADDEGPEWYRNARRALLGVADAADGAGTVLNDIAEGTGSVLASTLGEGSGSPGGPSAPSAPGRRGGGKTTQDFRFSQFEIQQKFEEGFDPDRIAVAFAQDVGRIGEQRMQSGFEPMFQVR